MMNSDDKRKPMVNSVPIDKDQLYGEFQRGQRWRDKLSRKVAHKALDIADDDEMNVNVRNGMGWKELLAAGVVAAVATYFITRQEPPPEPASVVAPVEDRDTTRRIEIEKYIPPGDDETISRLKAAGVK